MCGKESCHGMKRAAGVQQKERQVMHMETLLEPSVYRSRPLKPVDVDPGSLIVVQIQNNLHF